MIFVLCIVLFIITYMAYKLSPLGVLSPTFLAGIMFSLSSLVYVLTFYEMNSDISAVTTLLILGFILVTALGEMFAHKIAFRKQLRWTLLSEHKYDGVIQVSRHGIVGLTLVYLYVSCVRLENLRQLALNYAHKEQFSSVMEFMTNARYAYVEAGGSVDLSGTVANQFVYMSEITTYICIFIFIHNTFRFNHKSWYVLLPLIPDFINRVLTTSRTSFIVLFGAVMISFLVANDSYKHFNLKKIIVPLGIAIILFLIYGRMRNNAGSIPVVSYLQMYTCSAIYGLDSLVKNGWNENPYFGYNTLQQVYRMFGMHNEGQIVWGQMVTFSKSGYHANLYTSLGIILRDYGFVGSLLVRFIVAIISTKLLNIVNRKKCFDQKLLVYFYFVVTIAYCYFYSSTGDVFKDVFLNPYVMVRYYIYAIILVGIILRPEGRKMEERYA